MVAHTHNRSHFFEILSSLVSWPPPASRTAPSWPFQRALLLPALRPLCVSPPAPRATSGGHFHSALFLALTSPSKPRGTSPMAAAVPTGCLKGIWHFTGTNLAPDSPCPSPGSSPFSQCLLLSCCQSGPPVDLTPHPHASADPLHSTFEIHSDANHVLPPLFYPPPHQSSLCHSPGSSQGPLNLITLVYRVPRNS